MTDELKQLIDEQYESLENFIIECRNKNKSLDRMMEVYREAYQEHKEAYGSALNYFSGSYLKMMKDRHEYQKARVSNYLYNNDLPNFF